MLSFGAKVELVQSAASRQFLEIIIGKSPNGSDAEAGEWYFFCWGNINPNINTLALSVVDSTYKVFL
jgi:hypothetical protein